MEEGEEEFIGLVKRSTRKSLPKRGKAGGRQGRKRQGGQEGGEQGGRGARGVGNATGFVAQQL